MGLLHRHAQLDPVVRRMNQILLGPEVSLGGLDGCVPEQQLNMLQLATRRAAQVRACTATIVWGAIPGTLAAAASGRSSWQKTFSFNAVSWA
jgi:hypothetical protein